MRRIDAGWVEISSWLTSLDPAYDVKHIKWINV